MAQGAVLQLQVLQLFVQGLVFTDFACVVLFFEDTHTTSDTWRVVSSAFLTSNVKLVDEITTLRTVVLLLGLRVMRRLP